MPLAEQLVEGAAPGTLPSLAFFVSPQGSNGADGRTPQTPLRNIQEALDRAEPGETVLLLPGIYHEQILLEERGDASLPITLSGGAGGAVLEGQGRLAVGIQMIASRNIIIEQIEVRGYTDIGVDLSFSSGVVARRLVVHGNGFASRDPGLEGEGFGINVDSCADVILEDNETFENGPGPATRARGVFGTGINTYGNRHAVIRSNFSHHNVGGGILVEDSRDVLVEHNTVVGNDLDASAFNYWDGGLWLDGGRDIVVRNNVFRDNLGPGIEVSDEDDRHPTGYVFENNVSRGNYFGVYIWNFGTCPFPPPSVLRLSGNEFSGNSRQDVWCEER